MKLEPKLSQYGTTIYTIPKTNNHSRLLLHEFELDLLEQAVKYTYLRAVELVDYFVVIRENNGFTTDDEVRARQNAAKRLIRFKEAGVLKANDASEYKGHNLLYKRIFYTFTKRTLEILYALNRLTDNELAYYTVVLEKNMRFKPPSIHSVAIAALGTRLDLQLKSKLGNDDFVISKGTTHPLFKNYTDDADQIFPDLLLEFPDLNKLLVFEVDGGRQLRDVIESKYFRYKKMFSSNYVKKYNNELQAHVIFLPIDANFLTDENRSSKSHRIKYLKNCIPSFEKWGSSLNMFTIRYSAIEEFVNRTITFSEQLSEYGLNALMNQWIFNLESALMPLNYKVTVLTEQELLPQTKPTAFSPDTVIKLKQVGKKEKHYFVLYMNNGEIRSQQRYLETIQRLTAINESESNNLHINLLLLYGTCHSRATDALDDLVISDALQIFATSEEEWRELATAENMEQVVLPLYEQNNKLLSYTLRKENYRL
ncbi:hypothetical protein [Solibacillus sp. NPDC093137]|uniref:hypothetical protein n=1 Tax=Solibacillus sp. NPDC093137 TaxID=3390678 RepID=UPI003D051E48